ACCRFRERRGGPALLRVGEVGAALLRAAAAARHASQDDLTRFPGSQHSRRHRMTDTYRIFGSELSPYSVKVRSWFRYKRVPHEWIIRGPANEAEFTKHAKLPLIPLVVLPDGSAMQDSTPIIDALEAKHPDP